MLNWFVKINTYFFSFSVDKNFDLHDIPYDVLWLDIEHTDGKRLSMTGYLHAPPTDWMHICQLA